MRVGMLCGERTVDLDLPRDAQVLEPRPAEPLADPEGAVAVALESPMDSPPLAALARGRTDACVVISDITRPVPNRVILPPLLAVLERGGIPREKITILIATGMHRPNQGEELESMVGPEIMAGYRIVNHYCRRAEDVRQVAELDGAPIEINRAYLDADLKIITGLIEPHMYAGYSGGRKSILPGISSFRTMQYMHSFGMIDHPGVANCRLEGNPFHQAGEKVAALVGVDFMLNVVINQAREIVGVFAGNHTRALLAGSRLVAEHVVRRVPGEADLVITSGGGHPLDATFYQVSKGLIMARGLVRPGGAILAVCECREGLGSPEYCQLVRQGMTPHQFSARHKGPEVFVIDQWCLQTTYQALEKAGQVFVYSPHLKKEDLEGMGIAKVDNVQQVVDQLLPTHPRVVAAPQGPYVVGLVE